MKKDHRGNRLSFFYSSYALKNTNLEIRSIEEECIIYEAISLPPGAILPPFGKRCVIWIALKEFTVRKKF
jgi:hypothetical protein